MAADSPKRRPLTTDKQVRALATELATYEHSIAGTPGLRIRVAPTGRKSWLFRYRNRDTGKLERLVLGQYGEGGMSLADARSEAERQRAIADDHGSARGYREARRAENRKALAAELAKTERETYTVAKLVEEYLAGAGRTLKSSREVERALAKYVVPHIGSRPAADVARSEVIAVLDKLTKAGKAVQANRVLAYLRRAFNWALRQDKVANNPCAMIERNPERPKERAMLDAEIRRFLDKLPDSGVDPMFADAYRLILLTGMRPGEVAELAFPDVDDEDKTISLSDTKSGRLHIVPASPQVMAIIERRKKATKSPWMFPAPRDPRRSVRADALSKPLRDAIPKLKVLPLTPHDLRRSCATGLARLGAPRMLVALALNHAVQGVTGIYDRHSYQPELREWLEKWGDHVANLDNEGDERDERRSDEEQKHAQIT